MIVYMVHQSQLTFEENMVHGRKVYTSRKNAEIALKNKKGGFLDTDPIRENLIVIECEIAKMPVEEFIA